MRTAQRGPAAALAVQVASCSAAVLSLWPSPSHGAACCVSTSVTAVGRLALWERAAVGWSQAFDHEPGRWDGSGRWVPFGRDYRQQQWRHDLWGQLRLGPRLQAWTRAPWILGLRAAPAVGTVAAGAVGDVQLGARWDFVEPGEDAVWPALSVSAAATLPTATRPEQATALLGADASGRGVWQGALAVTIEKAWMPWFVRAEAALAQPASLWRRDLGQRMQPAPVVQGALMAGRELVAARWVVALQLLAEREGAYRLDGSLVAGSASHATTWTLSTAWRASRRWTWTAALAAEAPPAGPAAVNRNARWTGQVGVRHAFDL